ncbi:MAG: V-type ATPase subunit [Thermoprotei archaeon]
MIGYTYTYFERYLKHLLTREDFNTMLSADSIETAIKNIVEKPLGTILYDIIRRETYELSELYNALEKYNYARLSEIKRSLKEEDRRVLNAFDKLFDTLNLWNIVSCINNNRKPSIIYPLGETYGLDLSGINSVEKLVKILPVELTDIIDYLREYGVEKLSSIIRVYSKFDDYKYMGVRTRRIYGLIRDGLLIRMCLAIEGREELDNISKLLTLSREEFIEICNSKLENLPSIFHGMSPLYSEMGNVLSSLFKMGVSPEIFDLGLFLYASSITNDLLSSNEEVATRIYVLSIGETLLARTVLATLHLGMFTDVLRDTILKWWPL